MLSIARGSWAPSQTRGSASSYRNSEEPRLSRLWDRQGIVPVHLCGQMWDNANMGCHLGKKSTIAPEVNVGMAREGTEETSQVVMGGGGRQAGPGSRRHGSTYTTFTCQMSTHGLYHEELTERQVPHPVHGLAGKHREWVKVESYTWLP